MRRAARPSALAALAAAVLALACSGRAKGPPDAGGATDDVSVARALLSARELPPRPEVIARAQGVALLAGREGAGARAVELHALAAALVERVWRVEHREQDAREAIDLYRAAAKDLTIDGACAAAERAATLGGELAGDAQTTYAELYRAQRRSSGGDAGAGCASVGPRLALLAPFRPPAQVLDAIDQGLAGEGAIALAVADASSARVSVIPRLTRVEHWVGSEGARVVVHLDKPAPFRVGDVKSVTGVGARTYVELDGVELASEARQTPLSGIVRRVVTEPTSTGARVALELAGPAYRRVFHLVEPYRVVIDIAKNPPGASGPGARSVSRVVLDPGHGGNDPGATGPSGLKEKDVTLAVAHKAAAVLSRIGVEVALTRDDDRYITLEERTARANGFGADLFISIHCNASENRARRGVETYVLDTSKTDLAGRVAARENATSQAATAEIGQILATMRLADQATRSTRLAQLLQRAGVASLSLVSRDVVDGGVHTAGFYVLVGARMPAILLEASFLSKPDEAAALGTPRYRQALAEGIAAGITRYVSGS